MNLRIVEGDLLEQDVEVIVNAKNITCHKGVIRQIIWHSKDQRWHFWLEEDGRKVSKRYAAADLRLLQESSVAGQP